jgi:hypothetical protein
MESKRRIGDNDRHLDHQRALLMTGKVTTLSPHPVCRR